MFNRSVVPNCTNPPPVKTYTYNNYPFENTRDSGHCKSFSTVYMKAALVCHRRYLNRSIEIRTVAYNIIMKKRDIYSLKNNKPKCRHRKGSSIKPTCSKNIKYHFGLLLIDERIAEFSVKYVK